MTRVVVIGGGAAGCSTAFFLASNGADVTLLERAGLASEASGAAAGMLAALSDEGGDRGPAFQKLCIDSLELYQEILPELEATGVDLRYRRTGVLHLALDDTEAEHLRRRYEAQKAFAPELRWVERDEIAEEEPEASPEARAGLVSPREHYLDPQRLVLALATAARKHGARVETEALVTRFEKASGRLSAVRSDGRRFEADAFVLAAGPWTAALARRLGSLVPVRPVRGQMLALSGAGATMRRVVWGTRAYLVPRENGMTFVGATVEEVGFRKRNTVQAIAMLRREAGRLAPRLGGARIVSSWAGLRPGSVDNLPILGLLPGWSNVWVATGHFRNGILLSPITGKLMAASILAGRPDPCLEPFTPSRFQD